MLSILTKNYPTYYFANSLTAASAHYFMGSLFAMAKINFNSTIDLINQWSLKNHFLIFAMATTELEQFKCFS